MKRRLLQVCTFFPIVWTVLEFIMPRFVPEPDRGAYANAMIVVGVLLMVVCVVAIVYSRRVFQDKFLRMLFNALNGMIGFVHLCALIFYLMLGMKF